MITVRTSPAYVNRVRQDWTANGGVYGDGGVYALGPSNDPFAQLGPTLDLTFAGNPADLLTASTTAGYTLDTYFTPETYQIAVQYAVWENGLTQKNFSDIVTFTRASTGTYFNSAGTLTTAAINEARFDFNPSTLAAQGLLIEESRTNILLRSTLAGAVAGSPGTAPTGWTATAVGTPTLSLPTSIYGASDQALGFSGATGDRLFHSQTINVVDGTTYVYSAYCEASSGSPGTVLSVISGTSTATSLSTTAINPVGGAGVRVQVVFSVVGTGTVTVRMGAGVSTGLVAAGSVTLSRPQVEAGAFATSYIPTTTTALTRSADVASVNTLSPWLNQTEGTLFAEFTARLNATQTPVTFSGAAGVGYRVRKSSTNQYYAALRDGAPKDIAITPSPALTEGQIIKVAIGVKVNDCALSGGGQAVATQTSFSPMPTITDVNLGFTATDGNALNGWFRRFTYYPRRLANADLQAITA